MLQRRIELTDTIFVILFFKLGTCIHVFICSHEWKVKTLIDPKRPTQKRGLGLIKLFPNH
jgi:hypothetical protein